MQNSKLRAKRYLVHHLLQCPILCFTFQTTPLISIVPLPREIQAMDSAVEILKLSKEASLHLIELFISIALLQTLIFILSQTPHSKSCV